MSSCATTPKQFHHRFHFGNDASKHWERTITMPVTGKFVTESHYVTSEDLFPGTRKFANTDTENIQTHLERSLAIYQRFDPTMSQEKLYKESYKRVWTPAESGHIGQGSVGDIQKKDLKPEMELWMMNMMWAPGERPARGTKFLLSANNKSVVVIAGYETGPADQDFLGGVTCEVHQWLGTKNNSQITVAYLTDQAVAVGPIECQP